MVDSDDNRLVELCLNGDRLAFGALVEKYQRPIYTLALKMVRNAAVAEDISQAAFLKAFENLPSFDPTRKFFSWLYRIAMNEALNHLKVQQRFQEIPEETVDEKADGSAQVQNDESTVAIQQALMTLKPEYRSVIVLSHFEDLSYEEIAEVLHIPVRTVKSRLFSARQLLRRILVQKGVGTHE